MCWEKDVNLPRSMIVFRVETRGSPVAVRSSDKASKCVTRRTTRHIPSVLTSRKFPVAVDRVG